MGCVGWKSGLFPLHALWMNASLLSMGQDDVGGHVGTPETS